MKDFKKALRYFGVAFIFVISSVWSSNWIIPKPDNKIVQIDVNDRENGICAGMYKEGFRWGYGQFSIQVATDRLTKRSDEEIKNHLLQMAERGLPENFSP